MSLGGYPMGAENDPRAPYNEEPSYTEVEVTVSITLSKTIKVKTDRCYPDYLGKDEDGDPIIEYHIDEIALRKDIESDVEKELKVEEGKWNVDDFETIID